MPLTRRQLLTASLNAPAARLDDDITPTDRFFRQYSHPTPTLNLLFWSFSLGGLVRHPLSLSYADLLALPAIDLPCTVICAANPPGGERIGHAVWRGVPLADLLDTMTIAPQAAYARLIAAGGPVTGVSLERLRGGLLAYAMNGEALPPEQGFPARLIMPGLYDHKQPRWIQRVELVDSLPRGLWEQRGWSASGVIQTTSAITTPRHQARVGMDVLLAGYAYAGERAITGIALSVDGGPLMPGLFEPAPPNVWTRWHTTWTPPAPGAHEVSVYATDETGFTQSVRGGRPFPNGSSAVHSIVVYAGRE